MEENGFTGHIKRNGVKGNAYKFWSEKVKGRDHLGDLSVDGRLILK
jgi:hypothetical protein